MAPWHRMYGYCTLNVHYEELVRNPDRVGARIFAFCGLDYDPAMIRHEVTSDEIGHWKRYEPYRDGLRQAFGELAR